MAWLNTRILTMQRSSLFQRHVKNYHHFVLKRIQPIIHPWLPIGSRNAITIISRFSANCSVTNDNGMGVGRGLEVGGGGGGGDRAIARIEKQLYIRNNGLQT